LDEIKEWGLADGHRRRIILQNAAQRQAAHRLSFAATDISTI
jgi:predicted Fe-S protein YdhL (DUF1289 family)